MKRRHGDGFTLIELLVVIGLMVILAAFLFPVLALARDAACRSRCVANLHQLGLAHQLYVEEYDETLPFWQSRGPGGVTLLWTDLLQPYSRNAGLLDERLIGAKAKAALGWAADYALCSWGPGGKGTAADPYWRWPGCPMPLAAGRRAMALAEVRRPEQTLQISDGFTLRYNPFVAGCEIRRRHRNGLLNGVFLDGHARTITDAEWNRVGQDARGYFYAIAAADR